MQPEESTPAISDTTNRPWFRFHLLTGLLVNVVAAALLGIELGPLAPLLREASSKAPEVVGYFLAGDLVLVAAVAVVAEYVLRRRESRQ